MVRRTYCLTLAVWMTLSAPSYAQTPPQPTHLPLPPVKFTPLPSASQFSIEPSPKSQPEEEPFPKQAQEILDFWFGKLSGPADFPIEKANQWVSHNVEFDREIRSQFESEIQQALLGQLDSWRKFPRGRLALIILLDEFPRYIYRNKPQAFMADAMARGLTLEGIQRGDDKKLLPIERIFFYMPLQHSENLDLQDLSVKTYKKLLNETPLSIKPQLDPFLQYAILHQQIIARFKRFPHRNKILGRESTPEEMVYLNLQGGATDAG